MTRSYYDIANDAKKIEECYRDKTSFKELSEATGISRDSINNTLSKNIVLRDKVKRTIRENYLKAKKREKSETIVVVDISVNVSPVIIKKFKELDRKNYSFVFPKFSIDFFYAASKNNEMAANVLKYAYEHDKIVSIQNIKQSEIIEYCACNHAQVLTADINMRKKARKRGVKCIFLD